MLDLSGEGLEEISSAFLHAESSSNDADNSTEPLVELVLMHNKIRRRYNTSSRSRRLQLLSLRANRVEEISGLACCTALRELELYENQIKTLQGLDGLSQLTTLRRLLQSGRRPQRPGIGRPRVARIALPRAQQD